MQDLGLIPGLERFHGEGNGYPLQYSGLESSMECVVHGVSKSCTGLSNFHFRFILNIKHLICSISSDKELLFLLSETML